tara:strand:+ start:3192 stop:3329 length:138 start_codon:yes stop_codon:yes gene_type:complete
MRMFVVALLWIFIALQELFFAAFETIKTFPRRRLKFSGNGFRHAK